MLAIALGHAAIDAGYRVYYTTAADLAAPCRRAAFEGKWAATMPFFSGPAVLIIDELGYLPMPAEDAAALFQVIARRYLKGSVILTTNQIRGVTSSPTPPSPPPCWTASYTRASCSTSTVIPTGSAPTSPNPQTATQRSKPLGSQSVTQIGGEGYLYQRLRQSDGRRSTVRPMSSGTRLERWFSGKPLPRLCRQPCGIPTTRPAFVRTDTCRQGLPTSPLRPSTARSLPLVRPPYTHRALPKRSTCPVDSKNPLFLGGSLVGAEGFEPSTSSASGKRSPPELSARWDPECTNTRHPRRRPESNRCNGFCRPVPKPLGHVAKRGATSRPSRSGRRGSNPRPQPWQGCALPTELLPPEWSTV